MGLWTFGLPRYAVGYTPYIGLIGENLEVDPHITRISVDLIRQLYDEKVELNDGTRHVAKLAFDRCYVGTLLEEIDRLKAGKFTEDEFQNLCHCMDETKECQFKQGCEEYQR